MNSRDSVKLPVVWAESPADDPRIYFPEQSEFEDIHHIANTVDVNKLPRVQSAYIHNMLALESLHQACFSLANEVDEKLRQSGGAKRKPQRNSRTSTSGASNGRNMGNRTRK